MTRLVLLLIGFAGILVSGCVQDVSPQQLATSVDENVPEILVNQGNVVALYKFDGGVDDFYLRNRFSVKLDNCNELRTREGFRVGGIVVPMPSTRLRFAADGTVSAFLPQPGYWQTIGSLYIYELIDPRGKPPDADITYDQLPGIAHPCLILCSKMISPISFDIVRVGDKSFLRKSPINEADEVIQK